MSHSTPGITRIEAEEKPHQRSDLVIAYSCFTLEEWKYMARLVRMDKHAGNARKVMTLLTKFPPSSL